MGKIDKETLKEEFSALSNFCFSHPNEWVEYCNKNRNGKQSVEQISMLISSTTSPYPWRVIIGTKELEDLLHQIVTLYRTQDTVIGVIQELMNKLGENEIDGEK